MRAANAYRQHRVENYPLAWPTGRPRTPANQRTWGQLMKMSLARALDHLFREVQLAGGDYIVCSTNLEPRLDGSPRAGQREPDDPGVAVYFIRDRVETVIACDRWAKVSGNVRAIGKTVEALRGIERWGSSDMVAAAYRGYQGLPGPESGAACVEAPQEPRLPWWETLGVSRDADQVVVDAVLRALFKSKHPDRGGDAEEFRQVRLAGEAMRRERGLA